MKKNVEGKTAPQGEYRDLETLMEQGRQLHSKAVFEMCAGMFRRKTTSAHCCPRQKQLTEQPC
jgi:hypothetical protein